MSKTPFTSSRSRVKGAGPAARPDAPAEDDRPFAEVRKSVHDALRLLSLRRWAFFIPFSAVTCAAFILSLYYPRTYSATTTFERRNDPVMFNLPMSAGAASFKYFRNTMVRDLTSMECMREVVEKLGLVQHIAFMDAADTDAAYRRRRDELSRALGRTISVTTTSPSEPIDIVQITYTGPDPAIGKKLVDEVKRTYIQRTMAWIHEFLKSQQDYFEQEAQEALAEVTQAQRDETQLRLENPHMDPSNPGAIALKMTQLEMEHRELEMRKREYEAELSALKQTLVAAGPATANDAILNPDELEVGAIAPDPVAVQIAQEIASIDREIEKLRQTRGMTSQHPEISQRMERRRDLEQSLASTQGDAASQVRAVASSGPVSSDTMDPGGPAGWTGERNRLLVQIAAQASKLRDVEISLETNGLNSGELERARREIFQQQEEFAEVSGRVGQSKQKYGRLVATLATIEPAIKAIEQGRLLQFSEGLPARGSSIPVSPKAPTVVLLAVLAGLATGVVFVVLAEVFDHVYRSSAQVARNLGLPMLEAIDEIVTAQDRRYLFLKKVVVTPLIVACLITLTGLTGSMAYLSIERPWTYMSLRKIPEAAIHLFAGPAGSEEPSDRSNKHVP